MHCVVCVEVKAGITSQHLILFCRLTLATTKYFDDFWHRDDQDYPMSDFSKIIRIIYFSEKKLFY